MLCFSTAAAHRRRWMILLFNLLSYHQEGRTASALMLFPVGDTVEDEPDSQFVRQLVQSRKHHSFSFSQQLCILYFPKHLEFVATSNVMFSMIYSVQMTREDRVPYDYQPHIAAISMQVDMHLADVVGDDHLMYVLSPPSSSFQIMFSEGHAVFG